MIDKAPFGRTGHLSSRVIFGAAALGRMRQDRVDQLLPSLAEFGVNHIDTAASYGDSELRLAPFLAGKREDFFLATKTGDRSGDAARASLERSLDRLGVDHVDSVQLHNLVETDEWAVAHGPGGAVEALVRARDEGLTRFIGVTGHGLRIAGMHLASLERFDFDSVLFPYNFVLLRDEAYRRDVERLLEVCAQRNVAAQTIKSMARRRWRDAPAAGTPEPHFSWYEPNLDEGAVGRSTRFVLSNHQVFLITSSDARLLRPTLAAAEAAAAAESVPTQDEMEADVAEFGIEPLFDGADLDLI
jgi:aryl-alcohol dehydrogenase-like predicted oxidoreductase